jgi:hypothetical protein
VHARLTNYLLDVDRAGKFLSLLLCRLLLALFALSWCFLRGSLALGFLEDVECEALLLL